MHIWRKQELVVPIYNAVLNNTASIVYTFLLVYQDIKIILVCLFYIRN